MIVILTTLEVSFMLLANIYSRGVTHDNRNIFIVQATDVMVSLQSSAEKQSIVLVEWMGWHCMRLLIHEHQLIVMFALWEWEHRHKIR